jgi:putative transposase
MNKPKITDCDYINFLIGTQKVYSCVEAERVQPDEAGRLSHDAFTRQLHRLFPSTDRLWLEVREHVDVTKGFLICDDSTLDKFYSKKIELVTRHQSGKHKRVVSGINLITLLWTDGERYLPVDYRIYNKSSDRLTKNDHFRSMLQKAAERGFTPECVLFDTWYASLANLKFIRSFNWIFLTGLECNRNINPDKTENRPVKEADISEKGDIVHLKGYGMIKVFKNVRTYDDFEYWATNDLKMNDLIRLKYAELSWMIETYHRGIKQFCGIERCQARSERAQRNHIELALRAFLRLEYHCFVKGISWFEAKISIVRNAVRAYLAKPIYTLTPVNLYATA